jgi:hypothetical protein
MKYAGHAQDARMATRKCASACPQRLVRDDRQSPAAGGLTLATEANLLVVTGSSSTMKNPNGAEGIAMGRTHHKPLTKTAAHSNQNGNN